jgi:hypothetical protein
VLFKLALNLAKPLARASCPQGQRTFVWSEDVYTTTTALAPRGSALLFGAKTSTQQPQLLPPGAARFCLERRRLHNNHSSCPWGQRTFVWGEDVCTTTTALAPRGSALLFGAKTPTQQPQLLPPGAARFCLERIRLRNHNSSCPRGQRAFVWSEDVCTTTTALAPGGSALLFGAKTSAQQPQLLPPGAAHFCLERRRLHNNHSSCPQGRAHFRLE